MDVDGVEDGWGEEEVEEGGRCEVVEAVAMSKFESTENVDDTIVDM